jgi:hypothetical protein
MRACTPKNNPRNRHNGFLHPKKFKTQKSSSKVLASVLWDRDGILFVDCPQKDESITVKNYIELLNKLKPQLVS